MPNLFKNKSFIKFIIIIIITFQFICYLYNYCRKQFYFEKILGVSKQEDIEISIDKAMMGSIIHLVLQKLYTPYIGICLDEKSIINIQGEIIIELINALKHYHIDNTNRGKNLLAIEAIKSIITNFIDHEHNLIKCGNKITIEFLEHEILPQKLNTKLLESVNPQFQNIEINLKGHIDRVDVFNNTYRIIDYKTGLIQDSDLKSMDLNDMPAKPKVLQVLLYAWLFKKKKDIKSIPVLAGIINLRAQNFHFQPCVINKQSHIDEILLINFEKKLENILLEVFNPNQDFEHLNRDEKCRFCD